MPTLHLTVKPNQRTDALRRDGEGIVALIRAVPKDGEANAYLDKHVASYFGVAPSRVAVTKGHTSRHKTIMIDMDDGEFRERVAQIPI